MNFFSKNQEQAWNAALKLLKFKDRNLFFLQSGQKMNHVLKARQKL